MICDKQAKAIKSLQTQIWQAIETALICLTKYFQEYPPENIFLQLLRSEQFIAAASRKAPGKLRGMYGMADVDEFIAEAFTNPKFQQALKKVGAPVHTGGLASAWEWFVRVVRGMLGLKQGDQNALSAALDIGLGVMRENMAASKSGEATAGQTHYNLTEKASNQLYDLMHSDNKFNWLHKSVSAQLHKAVSVFNTSRLKAHATKVAAESHNQWVAKSIARIPRNSHSDWRADVAGNSNPLRQSTYRVPASFPAR